jgi:hypothetical protein
MNEAANRGSFNPGKAPFFFDQRCRIAQQLAFWNAHHDERGFASMHI